MSDDGFRPRKLRPKGWREQAIKDGVIADPDAPHDGPRAHEIAAALHTMNGGPGKRKDAIRLLESVPGHQIEQDDADTYVLVRTGGDAPGVFAPPSATITQSDDDE